MKLAAFISGGKDSMLALHKASEKHEVVCLVTVKPANPDSYMFHTVNVDLVDYIAICLEKPLYKIFVSGEKEKEVEEVAKALENLNVDGIVIGGIESEYQRRRFKKICEENGLKMFAPLWKKNPEDIVREVAEKFEAIIVKVSAEGLDEKWLGRRIDSKAVEELMELSKRYGIHPAGEGGEFETLVLNAPLYKKKLKINGWRIQKEALASSLIVEKIELESK